MTHPLTFRMTTSPCGTIPPAAAATGPAGPTHVSPPFLWLPPEARPRKLHRHAASPRKLPQQLPSLLHRRPARAQRKLPRQIPQRQTHWSSPLMNQCQAQRHVFHTLLQAWIAAAIANSCTWTSAAAQAAKNTDGRDGTHAGLKVCLDPKSYP